MQQGRIELDPSLLPQDAAILGCLPFFIQQAFEHLLNKNKGFKGKTPNIE